MIFYGKKNNVINDFYKRLQTFIIVVRSIGQSQRGKVFP